jgi:hypothetical protein
MKILFLDSRRLVESAETFNSWRPAETGQFISGLFFVHN